LKSVPWSRELEWRVSPDATFLQSDTPILGSIESTSGGKYLEELRMFQPGSTLTHVEIHKIWHTACRRYVEAATGRISIFAPQIVPNSVFEAIELPVLRKNSNVTLDFQ
jgi:hypothetical protein